MRAQAQNSTILIVGAVVVVLLLAGLMAMLTYNRLVSLNQEVDGAWANVQTQYQRRVDLIPNLVATVKGYANFEAGVLENVTAMRSAWANARSPADQIAAAKGLDGAIARLLVVSENYPDLKANQNFLGLQDELANTENKVAVERQRYNEKVRLYNTAIKTFPEVTFAGLFGFKEKPYFQAEAGASAVPNVNFT